MMLHHGRANTVDLDFYVMVEALDKLKKILTKEQVSWRSAGEYQVKAKANGIPIDILWADHYIGEAVVHRAIEKQLGNHWVRVATPEDLIILKTLADRSVDRRDIEELRELFRKKLDESYIERQLKSLKSQMEIK